MTIPVVVAENNVSLSVDVVSSVAVPVVSSGDNALNVNIAASNYSASIEQENSAVNIPVKCDIGIYQGEYHPYTGEYEFTPSSEEQVVEIRNKVAVRNIIINPIPQNYGLVEWNGSTLTIS